MKVINDLIFDSFDKDDTSYVFQIFPNVFSDSRGYFTEVLKDHGQWPKDNIPLWLSGNGWIRQINRSSSKRGTIRGCHAQTGAFCQGKLVEALTQPIYDIITDARPDSKTFGLTRIFLLDPIQQNKLWVPRGFLHSFVVTLSVKENENALFQYFCDNVFNKNSETGINPKSLLPAVVKIMKQTNPDVHDFDDLYNTVENIDKLQLSEKDCKAQDYASWMQERMNEYKTSNKIWYK